MSISLSLVQHDQRYSAQDGPQCLTTWPLSPLWCTFQPILSSDHLRSSVPTPGQPLCQRCRVLLLRFNPWGPIQNITPRTHQSRFHGRYWLFFRYFIYLDQTQILEHLRPSMPILIHWIHIPLVLGWEYKQGSQHASILFRVPHWFH